jgi:hypothetical protein
VGAGAQTSTGDILGTVRDASGAVVPGARIAVRNLGTSLSKETVTGDDGLSRAPLLPAGNYEVLVEKPGFARRRRGPITVGINERAALEVALSGTSSNEIVDVIADAPLVNTTNAEEAALAQLQHGGPLRVEHAYRWRRGDLQRLFDRRYRLPAESVRPAQRARPLHLRPSATAQHQRRFRVADVPRAEGSGRTGARRLAGQTASSRCIWALRSRCTTARIRAE